MAPPKVRPATVGEKIDHWRLAYESMVEIARLNEWPISEEALAIAAATLVSAGSGAPMIVEEGRRADSDTGPSLGGSAPRRLKPLGATCATCGQVIEGLDPGAWNDSDGVWTHTIPTCLIPGQVSGDIGKDMADVLAGRAPSVPLA